MRECGFCDAVLRSGSWLTVGEDDAAQRCPECAAGWEPYIPSGQQFRAG